MFSMGYILSMLKSSFGHTEAEKEFEVSENDLKDALPLQAHPAALEQSELARKLGCSGTDLQKTLQTILVRNPPFPLNKRKQELLRLYCEMPFLTPEAAAERLHISRGTYYRVRRETFNDLKVILIRIYH